MKLKLTDDQQRIVDSRDRSLLVSAAAGSGKTAVLVQRILKLLYEDKCDIDSMLIVTFTRAAAAQMKEKLYKEIEKKIKEEGGDPHLEKQLLLVHHADICTIDSFCSALVREHYNEAGISPDFGIADEGVLRIMQKEVLDELIDEILSGEDESLKALFDMFVKRDDIKVVSEIITKLYEDAQSLPYPLEWIEGLIKNYDVTEEDIDTLAWVIRSENTFKEYVRSLADEADELREYVILNMSSKEGAEHPYADMLKSDSESLMAVADCEDENFYTKLLNIKFVKRPTFKTEDEELKAKTEYVQKVRDNIKKGLNDQMKILPLDKKKLLYFLGEQRGSAECIINLCREFERRFLQRKSTENVYSFSDIEHFALNTLRDPVSRECTDTARSLRQRYKYVLVDEYQDSNSLQEELLLAVTGEEDGVFNYFMVGDVKQSIYRFRKAKPAIFMGKYDSFGKAADGYELITLSNNFRSRPAVCDCVNDVFSELMHRDLGGIEYDEANRLVSSAGGFFGEESDYKAKCYLVSKDDELIKNERLDNDTLEALLIADRIEEIVGRVMIKDEDKVRPAGFGDICILHRSANSVSARYMEVFNGLDIPVQINSTSGYFKSFEIESLLAMLEILDNPLNDIPLCNVLINLYDFCEEELAWIRASEEDKYKDFCRVFFEHAKASEAGEKPARFLAEFERIREECEGKSLSRIIIDVIKETGLEERVVLRGNGAGRLLNIEKLISMAISFESANRGGLYEFLQYAKDLNKLDIDMGLVNEGARDAVSLMTIHKSKGLEFPICILAGCGKQFKRKDTPGSVVISEEDGMAMDYINRELSLKISTPYRDALLWNEQIQDSAENQRLLYVAMTRAKEMLVMTGVVSDKTMEKYAENEPPRFNYKRRLKAESFLDMLAYPLFKYGYEIIKTEPADFVKSRVERYALMQLNKEEAGSLLLDDSKNISEEMEAVFAYAYPIKAGRELKSKYTVSEVKQLNKEITDESDEEQLFVFDEEKKIRKPSFIEEKKEANEAALIRGTAVHRFMECVEFKNDVDVEEEIARLTRRGFLTEEQAKYLPKDKLKQFFKSELAGRMIKACERGELYRERIFVMNVLTKELFPGKEFSREETEDTTLVQGVIDACFIEEGEFILLDYKTDRVNNDKVLTQRYESQLKMYKRALVGASGTNVSEVYIYSFETGSTIRI